MGAPRLRTGLVAGLALLMSCSSSPPEVGWWEQRQPSGPCWEANLADGLSTESADEIHAIYRCLNKDGGYEALSGLDASMDTSSRADRPLGAEIGQLALGLSGADLDLLSVAGVALDLLDAPDEPIEPLLEISVELLYGQPYGVIANGGVNLKSESALGDGVVVPLLPVVSGVSEAILDDGDAVPALLADALESETLDDAVCTMVGLASSGDPDVEALRARLLPDLGAAIADARSPENDRWSEASGDSLRDLLDGALLETRGDGKNAVAALAVELEPILEDDAVRDGLRDALQQALDEDQLDTLPAWAQHLVEVDAQGVRLCDASVTTSCSSEDSALVALLRLLAESNADVECSFIGISLYDGNFAIDLLKMLAALDPDTAASLTDLAGAVLGWSWTGDVLEWILGSCVGADTAAMVADLDALDRLNDPESGELLGVLVGLLGAVYDEGQGRDQLQPLVDTLTVAHDRGLLPPLEEVLRDLGNTPIADDVVALVPLLLDPGPLDVDACPDGSEPLELEQIWALVGDALLARDRDQAPLATLQPVFNATLTQDATYTALGNLGGLLAEQDASVGALWELIPELVAVNPDLSLVHDLGPLIRDEQIRGPALRLLESRPLTGAVGETSLTEEGPLPFAARLVTGGTLDAVLRTVDLVLGTLGG